MKKEKNNTVTFVQKAQRVHGDKYDYSVSVYTKSSEKISIRCTEHGVFMQEANTHLKGQGCPICGKRKRVESIHKKFGVSAFIEKAKAKHGDTYEYGNVVYKNNRESVEITCKIHGGFKQSPRVHTAGHGCPACAKTDNNYWSYSGWEKAGSNSSFYDSFKVYVVRLSDENESFIKIGKTYNKLERRFSRGQVPYAYEVLHVIEGNALDMCKLEQALLNLHIAKSYTPKKTFAGSKECFSELLNIERYL